MSAASPAMRELLGSSLETIRALREELERRPAAERPSVAVVGIGARFPGGGDGPEAFWSALLDGVDAVAPSGRDGRGPGAGVSAGLLRDVDAFDAGFFGISAAEASAMDPQQRVALEVAWEAVEDAGVPLETLRTLSTGVYVGVYQSDYLVAQLEAGEVTAFTGPGTAHSVVANRISYALDLSGPSLAVDTACSSSLVAVHLACQALRAGECDVAIAGGVNLLLSPHGTEVTGKVLPLAPGRRCRPFDAAADGIVRGEGCGFVVLRRVPDAAGDRVRAVMRGSAVNQDGRTNGLTAPSPRAQQRLIERALADARVPAQSIGYVEAHGTGTPLGDPIEVEALAATYGAVAGPPCAVGSLKANLGHLEACAGIAGLIKTVLVLERARVPATPHLAAVNPHLRLDGTRLRLTATAAGWNGPEPRRAAVSAFGFGGTNAHIVLEEAAPASAEDDVLEAAAPASAVPVGAADDPLVLPISARSGDALAALKDAYAGLVARADREDAAAIARAAARRRSHHPHRLAVHGRDGPEMAAALAGALEQAGRHGEVALVFGGQGTQWPGMGSRLLADPRFGAVIDACDELLDWSLHDALGDGERLRRTDVAQPAIFALQAGLAAVLEERGIEPVAVAGHSVGEVTAAYVAGVLSLPDAIRVLVARGAVMHELAAGGAMIAVQSTEDAVRARLTSGLDVAVVNGPSSVVVAGAEPPLAELERRLTGEGIRARRVPVGYGFHSPLLDAAPDRLRSALAGIAPRAGHIALYSTVTGTRIDGTELGAGHWARGVRAPVRLDRAVAELLGAGAGVLVEVAPHPALLADLNALAAPHRVTCVPTLRRDADDRASLADTTCRLYMAGARIDWSSVHPGPVAPAPLPRYPWQRRRFWLRDADAPAPPAEPRPPLDPDAILGFLRTRIGLALGLEEAAIHPDVAVDQIGLDSLMVVELKNQAEARFGLAVPMSALLGGRSLREVVVQMARPDVAAMRDDDITRLLTAMVEEPGT